jgi:nucleoside-diphosphate-sugar epimerase
VFNYAAEPYVPASYERPLHVFDINARGALMVMNAAQDAGVKGILQVSSAEIYGDGAQGLINEDFPARPRSTYGAAKLAIDTMVQTRWRESGCPVISLRQFNCLGERDVLHPYVVPEIYRQAKASDTVRLGNNSYRDFMYAGDAVRMAVALLEMGQYGEVYNLGAQEGIKIFDLAKMVGSLLGKSITVVQEEHRKRAWEIWHLQSDNTKIYGVVDVRPKVSLEEAVRRTIDYYEDLGAV